MRKTIPDQFEDLGYDTHNSMVNTSSILAFLFILLSLMPFWFLLKTIIAYIDRKEKVTLSKDTRERKRQLAKLREEEGDWRRQARRVVEWLEAQLFYRWLFAVMVFGFVELIIAGVLNMNTYTKSRDFTFNETVGVFFAYFSLIFCLIVLPVFYVKQHLDGYEMGFG